MRSGLRPHASLSWALTLAAAGCGGGAGQPPVGTRPTTMLVGAAGAVVSTSDGNFTLDIPPGALANDTIIAVQPTGSPAAGALGTVYEIGPTGLQFAFPVTLTLHYDAAALTGSDKSLLRVATYAGAAWQILPGAVVDTRAKTVTGVTMHLSSYTIVWQATGKTCAPVQAALGCGTGAGADPDAGTLAACGTPTCAGASNACAPYPGAAMDSCVDGQNGYSAACCFPSGAPICFATAAASGSCATATAACDGYPGATLQGCTDGTAGFSGGCCFGADAPVCVAVKQALGCSPGTGGCPTSPPRCADGDPCAGYAGATAQSCTDTTDGFQATCCFAVGTLPIKAAP